MNEVYAYRAHVAKAVAACYDPEPASETYNTVVLGLNHEQQHQELMLTDIKRVLSCNPLEPTVHLHLRPAAGASPTRTISFPAKPACTTVGAEGPDFCFDNELPRHQALLQEHSIGSRLITNGEYLDFIRDGG